MKEMLSNYLLGAIACIVLGIAVIIKPLIITDVLGKALGVILIVWGAVGVLSFFISRSRGSDASFFSMVADVVKLAAGIYVFVDPDLLVKIVMIAIGFYLLCSGVPEIISACRIRRIDPDRWVLPLVFSIITSVIGAVMLLSPIWITSQLMRLVGVILLAAGISNFMSGFNGTRLYNKLKKDIAYSGGRGRDDKDTSDEDKANAIDV